MHFVRPSSLSVNGEYYTPWSQNQIILTHLNHDRYAVRRIRPQRCKHRSILSAKIAGLTVSAEGTV